MHLDNLLEVQYRMIRTRETFNFIDYTFLVARTTHFSIFPILLRPLAHSFMMITMIVASIRNCGLY